MNLLRKYSLCVLDPACKGWRYSDLVVSYPQFCRFKSQKGSSYVQNFHVGDKVKRDILEKKQNVSDYPVTGFHAPAGNT